MDGYDGLIHYMDPFRLDSDDAYQYTLAKSYNLKIVSMDKDFQRVTDIEIINFNEETDFV